MGLEYNQRVMEGNQSTMNLKSQPHAHEPWEGKACMTAERLKKCNEVRVHNENPNGNKWEQKKNQNQNGDEKGN